MPIPHDPQGELSAAPDITEDAAPAVAAETAEATAAESTPPAVSEETPAAEQARVGLAPREDSATVRQDFETFAPLEGNFDPEGTTVYLSPETSDRLESLFESMPRGQMDSSEHTREWLAALEESYRTRPQKDYFAGAVERPGSQYLQAVPSDRGGLGAGVPTLKDLEGSKVSGDRAVWRVRTVIGLGSVVQVPLWHSGFWVTLKAPGEGEQLELYRRIIEEKITLGRMTFGLAFSNTSVFYTAAVMNLAISCIYETTLKDKDAADIREKISSLDIPVLAWGLACAIYPRGFQYARATTDESAEGGLRIVKERLNVGKLMWTDVTSLTAWQRTHMSQRASGVMNWEGGVQRYREEFTRGKGKRVQLSEKLSVTFRVPSLQEHITSGNKWVNTIVTMANEAFGIESEGNLRNSYIYDQGRATYLRQYGHWVEQIGVASMVIDDVETVEKSLDSMSASDEVRSKFFDEQRKFLDDSIVSIIAVPVVGEKDAKPLPRFPHLLPLDVMSTFFILLGQKVGQIQAR